MTMGVGESLVQMLYNESKAAEREWDGARLGIADYFVRRMWGAGG